MNARARWTSLAGAGVVALLAISAVSCKKGEAVEPASPVITVSEFEATAGGHAGDGKTMLDDVNVFWTYGDDAMVFGVTEGDGTTKGDVTIKTGRYVAEGGFGTATTKFTAADGAVSGSKFYAVYPYGAAENFVAATGTNSATVDVTIPEVQTCNEAGNFANGANVMAAYTDNSKLAFTYQNVCGVLRLTLKGSATVKSITVRSKEDEQFTGTGTLTFSSTNTHELKNGVSGSNAVTLSCPNGVKLTSEGEGTQFNLVVAPGVGEKGFDVTVACDGGVFMTSAPAHSDNTIVAGKILSMPAVPVTVMDGVLPGEFSVSATDKVHFSRGNMYWDGDSYEFEANQYDYRMHYQHSGQEAVIYGVKQATPGGTVGSFVWVNNTQTSPKPYAWNPGSVSGGTSDFLFTNAAATTPKADFTVNGQKGVWRTLSGGTDGEWNYLIDSRVNSGGTNANTARFARATVQGVQGMMIFPDGAVLTGTGTSTSVSLGTSSYSIQYVNVKDKEVWPDVGDGVWVALESAGVVFLPCTGYRNGTTVDYVGTNGYYWSSSPDSSDATFAYFLHFNPGNVFPASSNFRRNGRSVRLVL